MANHYEIIGVPPDASIDQIRAAYRLRLRTVHPDFHHDATPEVLDQAKRDTVELNEAWYVLGDPGRRAAYDLATITPADFARPGSSFGPTIEVEGSLCPHCGARNSNAEGAERATCRSCHIEYGLSACRFCRTVTPLALDVNIYRCPGCHKSERPPWGTMGTPRRNPPAAASGVGTGGLHAVPDPGAPGRSAARRAKGAGRSARSRLSASGMLTGAGWVLLAMVLVAGIGAAAAIGNITAVTVQLLAAGVFGAWLLGRYRERRR